MEGASDSERTEQRRVHEVMDAGVRCPLEVKSASICPEINAKPMSQGEIEKILGRPTACSAKEDKVILLNSGQSGNEGIFENSTMRIEQEMRGIRASICPKVNSTPISREKICKLRELAAEQYAMAKASGESTSEEVAGKDAGQGVFRFGFLMSFFKYIFGMLLLLWVCFEVVSLVDVINNLSGVLRWVVGLFVLIVILVAVVSSAVYACLVFRRIPKNKPVIWGNYKDIKELKAELRKYVAQLDGKDYGNKFCGKEKLGKLLNDEMFGGITEDWIKTFKDFQDIQVDFAKQRVKESAMRVGYCTAVCPWSAGDILIVFSSAVEMVASVAEVFDCRMSKLGAFKWVCHWLKDMYIAGHLQNVTEVVGEKGAGFASKGFEMIANDETWVNIFTCMSGALKKVIGKASEGVVNALLCYRLGMRAIDEFRKLQ